MPEHCPWNWRLTKNTLGWDNVKPFEPNELWINLNSFFIASCNELERSLCQFTKLSQTEKICPMCRSSEEVLDSQDWNCLSGTCLFGDWYWNIMKKEVGSHTLVVYILFVETCLCKMGFLSEYITNNILSNKCKCWLYHSCTEYNIGLVAVFSIWHLK